MGPHIGESFGIDLDAPDYMQTSVEESSDSCKAKNLH